MANAAYKPPGLALQIRETSGPTVLTMGAVADGEFLARSGSTIIGAAAGGGGITTLNGLMAAMQTFAVASGGSDFAISSNVNVHNFSIPDAGVAARGLVTTGAQTFGGTKSFSAIVVPMINSLAGIAIRAADGTGASPGQQAYVQSGDGGPTNGAGGLSFIAGGTGGGANGIGGAGKVGGGGGVGTGAGGAAIVEGGSALGSAASGAAFLRGGTALGTGVGGAANVTGGDSAVGVGGGVEILAGLSGGANAGASVNITGGLGGPTDGDGGDININAGAGQGAGVSGVINIAGTEAGVVNIGTASGSTVNIANASGTLGFYGFTSVAQQTVAALANNVTAGGTDDQVDNWTSLVVYATDAAAIRNAIYQLARKLEQVNNAIHTLGLYLNGTE